MRSLRTISLPWFLIKILQQQKANPKVYVLTGTKARFMEPRTMQYRFEQCYGLWRRRCEFSCLTAYVCHTRGRGVKSRLRDILGHSNVKITLERHCSFFV
jgi:hypothetical protein